MAEEGRSEKVRRGTGIWPFALPRPWVLDAAPGEAVLIDDVVVASVASRALQSAGWPGIALMDRSFLLDVINAADSDVSAVEPMVSKWYEDNRIRVAEELRSRLRNFDIDEMSPTARIAMTEALANYESEHFLSVVRTLMPEFEAFARHIYGGKSVSPKQSDVIQWLKETIDEIPAAGDDAIDMFSLYHFIDTKLFARCFTVEQAEAFGDVVNRHAEMHALSSYGHLKGATTVLCVTSYLMGLMDRYRKLSLALPGDR